MDGIEWAASAMAAAKTRLDIATQNIANGSSDGFRRAQARGSLTERGVRVDAVRDSAQGALRRTGRTDDFAIAGGGYFVVRDDRGRQAHSRNGAFVRDRFGHLRDALGRAFEGTHLAPGASVRRGFLESSNVNAIGEMIDVLTAQRSFETAQKTLSAIDQTRDKAANEVARLK
ncbi:MAG TPA: flagellar basal body rod C-terminal domain-containing protein [Candidatus Baltobacteraceae bacterium]|jgi:flagellar basal body rod protein FlgG